MKAGKATFDFVLSIIKTQSASAFKCYYNNDETSYMNGDQTMEKRNIKVGISNDHSAVELKNSVMKHLQEEGYEVINYGTDSTESYDYPLAATALAKGIQNKEVDLGIAICGTGVGISIACNKHKGIRACCCSEATSARLTREHNDANIICFGARIISTELANDIADTFLSTPFSNGERHKKRIAMIHEIEQ